MCQSKQCSTCNGSCGCNANKFFVVQNQINEAFYDRDGKFVIIDKDKTLDKAMIFRDNDPELIGLLENPYLDAIDVTKQVL